MSISTAPSTSPYTPDSEVPASSPPSTPQLSRGKRIAFPSPDAFVGYAVPVMELKKADVRVDEVFAGNQEGALAQLKARRVEGAAVNSRFLAQYAEREVPTGRQFFVKTSYLFRF